VFRKSHNYQDHNDYWKLEIDGCVVGEITPDQWQTFRVVEGTRVIRVKNFVLKSNELDVVLEKGREVSLVVAAPRVAGFRWNLHVMTPEDSAAIEKILRKDPLPPPRNLADPAQP